MREINNSEGYLEDYLLRSTAEQVEELERIRQQAANLTQGGAATGQIAVWDGSSFVPGVLVGDSNGISVVVVTSPFGLRVQQSQDLKTSASPTFNSLTLTSLLVGSGGTLAKKIQTGNVNADPGSIAAQTRGSVDVTITGVAPGDRVHLQPPDALNTGLVYAGCRVVATDTLRIYIANITGTAIDDGNLTWSFIWIDFT